MKSLIEWSAVITKIAECILGGVLWFMWMLALVEWWGTLWGVIGGIFLFPGLFLFPIIYWLVEDAWPVTYLILYGIGIGVGLLAALLEKVHEDPQ